MGRYSVWKFTPRTKPGDVNRDGVVDILDLTFVGSNIGRTGQNDADVNGDGIVDILDLVEVAGMFGETMIPAAPIAFRSPENGERSSSPHLNRDTVQEWVDMAHTADDGSLIFRRGTRVLEQLLAALPPQETASVFRESPTCCATTPTHSTQRRGSLITLPRMLM